MSDTVDTAFVNDYVARVHHKFQRSGSYVLNAVFRKTDVIGNSTIFPVLGKGTAVTKARHADVTTMNLPHTEATATLVDFYAAEDVDRLDESKTNVQLKEAYAESGAMAIGRKIDDQIITALDTTTQTAVSWDVSSEAAVRNSLLLTAEALWANDVPNDAMVYALLTPRAWNHAMTVKQFASSDWVGSDRLPWTEGTPTNGRWRNFMNVMWGMHTGLPGRGTATAKMFAWHKNAVGYASGRDAKNIANAGVISADIWWNGDAQRHRITHCMTGGAVLIDDTGVIEMSINDTTALATS